MIRDARAAAGALLKRWAARAAIAAGACVLLGGLLHVSPAACAFVVELAAIAAVIAVSAWGNRYYQGAHGAYDEDSGEDEDGS
jgi:hypothetical protein